MSDWAVEALAKGHERADFSCGHAALDDFWWADRFRWTPAQVDELGYRQANRLRSVTEAIDEGRAKRADAEAKRET